MVKTVRISLNDEEKKTLRKATKIAMELSKVWNENNSDDLDLDYKIEDTDDLTNLYDILQQVIPNL